MSSTLLLYYNNKSILYQLFILILIYYINFALLEILSIFVENCNLYIAK